MNLLRPGASILGAKRLKRLVPKEFVIRQNDVLVAGFVTVKISENGWKHNDGSLGGAPYDGAYTGKLRIIRRFLKEELQANQVKIPFMN